MISILLKVRYTLKNEKNCKKKKKKEKTENEKKKRNFFSQNFSCIYLFIFHFSFLFSDYNFEGKG